MADEIARLGVAVDSTSAVSAAKDVEALAKAGDHASDSARKLGGAWQSMSLSPTQLFSTNKSVGEFRTSMMEAAKASTALDQEWKKAAFSPTKLMSANQALAKFRQDAKDAGMEAGKLAQSNKIVAESHHQVAKAAAGYTKSAKEMAFATRNLPAQFTDIAVSLQAGQNPLTVLLQQGGQLKDMFGGVGPAAKALGSYVMGLVSPLALAAGAVAALSIAWIKGDAEARRFHQTLELQGNTLGASTDTLVQASERMERFTVTQGAASAALNATAASGKIFSSNIQLVAEAALNLERAGGQAIEKTVEQFATLAGEPVQAAIKLDEQYHFLTTSVYETIKSLEDQGDTMGATQVAMDALASAIDQRGQEIEKNLSTLEHAWRGVGMMAKWAWDRMMDIGRPDSLANKMSDVGEKIREIENPSNALSFAQLGPKGSAARKKAVDDLRKEMLQLQDQYVADQKQATRKMDENLAAEASRSLDQEVRRYASNADKRVLERARIQATANKAAQALERVQSAGWVKAVEEIRRDEAKAIEQMEKRLKDPKEPKAKKSQEAKDAERLLRERAREYESLDTALDRHAETLAAAGEAQDKLSAFERYAIKTLSDLENGHTKLDSAQQAEVKTRIEALRVIDQANQARDKQNKIMAASAELHRRIAEEEMQQVQAHRSELSGIGRGSNEAALERTLEDIRVRSMQERTKLEEEYQKLRAVGSAQYLSDLKAIDDAEQRLVSNEISQLERKKAAMSDWRNGARSAMEDIAWEMGDTAGRTRDAFMNTFQSMNNALTNFAQTGKIKIRDFATVVIAELARIALTIALSKALTSMFGATAASGAGSSGEQASFDSWFQNNNAKGNVFQSGRTLSTYGRGTVRTSPTLFPMANGMGLMAEQSAEAIMPLDRGADGKLGVRARGGGGSITNVSTSININQGGEATSSTKAEGDNAREGRRLAELVDSRMQELLAQERRQGGILWAMQNGR